MALQMIVRAAAQAAENWAARVFGNVTRAIPVEVAGMIGLAFQKTGRRSVILHANIATGRYPRVPRWWSRYDAELNPFRHCAIVRHGPPAYELLAWASLWECPLTG